MKIRCQQCESPYAIDDKYITAKGIRAQCPKCKHLQLVKKEEPSADPLASLSAAQNARPDADPSPFLFDAAPVAVQPPTPQPAVTKAKAAPQSSAAFVFESPAPQATRESSGSVAANNDFDFGMSPPPQLDFGGSASEPADQTPVQSEQSLEFGQAQSRCESCGKVLLDPLDQAIGRCDACRNESTADTGSASTPAQSGEGVRLSLNVPSEKVAYRPAAGSPVPATHAVVARPRGAWVRNALISAALLAVLGFGIFVLLRKPWVAAPPALVVNRLPQNAESQALLASWKAKYPELSSRSRGDAAALVLAGEKALAFDSTQGYLDAREAFQKALVLDPEDDRALAGWVLGLAFSPAPGTGQQVFDAASSMLAVAERQSGKANLYVAQANLMAARHDNANDIIAVADTGKSSPDKRLQALALLATAQAQVQRNTQTAESLAKAAVAADPTLKHAQLIYARLLAANGNFQASAEAYRKRLAGDLGLWESVDELARLEVELGEPAEAKSWLEKAKAVHEVRAQIALAQLQFEVEGNANAAAEGLQKVLALSTANAEDKLRAAIRLSAVKRAQGDVEGALSAASQALELEPESVPARFQRLLALIRKPVASQARLDFDAMAQKWPNGQLALLIEGKLLQLEGRVEEAARAFEKAAQTEPLTADSMLLAGAANAQLKRDGKAWEWCVLKAAHSEPSTRVSSPLGDWLVTPAELLDTARGAYSALNRTKTNDPNSHFCEALVAFFSNDWVAADTAFGKTLGPDPRNPEALAFRALTALKRKSLPTAAKFAEASVEAGRTVGLAHAALAAVRLAQGKVDAAKTESTAALKYSPQLRLAQTIFAEVDARLNRPEDAKKVLRSVLSADENYREAKRVLYKYNL